MYSSPKPRMIASAGITAVADSSGGEEHEIKTPKRRAETWILDETRCLIALRREIDGLFNTSKSNKHLWEQISSRLRDKGFDRSATMCTDKWRNLLKEFKKTKHRAGGRGASKTACFKELDELLKERSRNAVHKSSRSALSQFVDKGFEDDGLPFGYLEADGRAELNSARHADHNLHTLAITASDPVTASGVPPWHWRDNSGDGGDTHASCGGRVILVKWGEYVRKIGIDGTAEAIKETIKSAFGLRTRRAFWLEDEDEVVCSLDRDMPIGAYTLHLDEGITVKVCMFNDPDQMPMRTEDKTFYTEDDFYEFLARRGWIGLRELTGFRILDTLDDLRGDAIYQGVRSMAD